MPESIDLGLLILRVGVGLVITGHGLQKLLGWWDGPGFRGWIANIRKMGMWPAEFWAVASMASEVVGGLLLAAGLLTPLATAAMVGPMTVVVLQKWPKGFWNVKGGYEYPLVLLIAAIGLAATGPGSLSLDAALGLRVTDAVRAALVVVAAAGAFGGVAMSRARTRAQQV